MDTKFRRRMVVGIFLAALGWVSGCTPLDQKTEPTATVSSTWTPVITKTMALPSTRMPMTAETLVLIPTPHLPEITENPDGYPGPEESDCPKISLGGPFSMFSGSESVLSPVGTRLARIEPESNAIFMYRAVEGETVWEPMWSACLCSGERKADGGLVSVAFSPDQKILAVGFPGMIQLVDVETGDKNRAFPRPQETSGMLRYSADGAKLISAAHSISLLDSQTGKLLANYSSGSPGGVRSVRSSSNGSTVAGTVNLLPASGYYVYLWAAGAGQVARIPISPYEGGDPEFDMSIDGEVLALLQSTTPAVEIRRARDGQLLGTIPLGKDSKPITLAISPYGSTLAVLLENGTAEGGRAVEIWNLRTRTKTGTVPVGVSWYVRMFFSRDGSYLFVGDGGTGESSQSVTIRVATQSVTAIWTLPPPSKPTVRILEPASADIPFRLSRLFMIDEESGWGQDTEGRIVATMDGGYSWEYRTPPELGTYFYAYDPLHAWMFPRWLTEDGGRTWKEMGNLPDYPPFITDVQFFDPLHGWVLADDCCDITQHGVQASLWITRDGGKSWEEEELGFDPRYVSGIAFVSPLVGFFGERLQFEDGYSTLQQFLDGSVVPILNKTEDGGHTWASYPLPRLPFSMTSAEYATKIKMDCGIQSVRRFPASVIRIGVGCHATVHEMELTEEEYGRILARWPDVPMEFTYLSVDGGATWHARAGDVEEWLFEENGIRILDPKEPMESRMLQRTIDAGRTWLDLRRVAWQETDFYYASPDCIFGWISIGDLHALLRSDDGGNKWAEIIPEMVVP